MSLFINEEPNFMFHPAAVFDNEVTEFTAWEGSGEIPMAGEYAGWQKENLSWKETCYLHVNLSAGMANLIVKGPDAEKLMSYMCVNSFSLDKFKIGRGKHVVACAPNGNIIQHGMVLRVAEDEFHTYNLDPVVVMHCNSGRFNVEPLYPTYDQDFVFQLAGPKSLEIVENTIKEDIHDLKFMEFRPAAVLGHTVRVIRMGMGGTISYEIHGELKDAHEIYAEIMKVGEPYGLQRLGVQTYMCNHTENGFVQNGEHFISDWETDPEVRDFVNQGICATFPNLTCKLNGSLADQGRSAYYLNILEAGWGHLINWDHDFIGKEALQELVKRDDNLGVVTLEWNKEDILKVFETFLDDEPGTSHYMKFPQNLKENGNGSVGNNQDKVLDKDGNLVGKSTGRIYTIYYKKVISLGFVKPEFQKEGTELTVLWGDADERQIPIRVKVARFPYLDLTPNKDFDLETIPHFKG